MSTMNHGTTTARGTPSTAATPVQGKILPRPEPSRFSTAIAELRRINAHPLTSYYILVSVTCVLVALGVVMVLSASFVLALGTNQNVFSELFQQGFYALLGIGFMFFFSRLPIKTWKKLAGPIVVLGIIVQFLPFLPGIGTTINGSQSWIKLGSLTIQPSEFGKFALVLWLGMFLAAKEHKLNRPVELLPLLGICAFTVGPVLYGNDLGTGLMMMSLILGGLFVGGFPKRYFAIGLGGIMAIVAIMVFSSPNRMLRIKHLLGLGGADEAGIGGILGNQAQVNHALYAIATGGWSGVGLGASREKWGYLPAAESDYIFAIIGEELGVIGCIIVLILYLLFAYACIRLIVRSSNRLIQTTAAAVFSWVLAQAFVNMLVVTKILPVIGVPLPFISKGGSALIATCMAVGLLASFARREPGAPEVIAARRHARQLRRTQGKK